MRRIKNLEIYFRFTILAIASTVTGQELSSVILTTPEVAAIEKYIDAPVDHFMGARIVSVPLVSISEEIKTRLQTRRPDYSFNNSNNLPTL